MSESAVEGGQGTGQEVTEPVASETPTVEDQGGGESINPAWNDLLGIVPSMLHSQVTPHLQKWDKNYQDGINKVHEQYATYKPYLDANIQPDQINYGLQLIQAIEQRPAEVIAAIQQYTGTVQPDMSQGGAPTDPQGQQPTETPEWLQHPEFQKMSQTVQTLAQIAIAQNQQAQESQQDAALEEEMDSLQEKYKDKGGFDEEWVLQRAAMNPQIPLEKHVEAYMQFVSGLLANQNRPNPPQVLPSGGSVPTSKMDPSKLDGQGRRAYIADLLAKSQQGS